MCTKSFFNSTVRIIVQTCTFIVHKSFLKKRSSYYCAQYITCPFIVHGTQRAHLLCTKSFFNKTVRIIVHSTQCVHLLCTVHNFRIYCAHIISEKAQSLLLCTIYNVLNVALATLVQHARVRYWQLTALVTQCTIKTLIIKIYLLKQYPCSLYEK